MCSVPGIAVAVGHVAGREVHDAAHVRGVNFEHCVVARLHSCVYEEEDRKEDEGKKYL
jgi:hypothetical protein